MKRGLESYRKAVNPWTTIILPRFSCGHVKTEENSIVNRFKDRGVWREYKRCRTCHNRNNEKYRMKAGNKQ